MASTVLRTMEGMATYAAVGTSPALPPRAVRPLVAPFRGGGQHRPADDGGDVDVRLGGDLTGDVHLAGGDERLDRDPAPRGLAGPPAPDGGAGAGGARV